MLELETVQQDIEKWIQDFVEVPHPALGGWAPCPYARKARLDRDFEVRVGINPFTDLIQIARDGIKKSVVIIAYNPKDFDHAKFSRDLDIANNDYLLPVNLLALEDHPDDKEIVNTVCMNQGSYALALVQSLSDLNEKAQLVGKKGFYDTWPEKYLQTLFKHRIDPRQS